MLDIIVLAIAFGFFALAVGYAHFYAGVAPRKCNGVFDVDALGAGEFIVRPGLVYRRVNPKM